MQKDTHYEKYQTQDNQTTSYQVEIFQEVGKTPIAVIRAAPNNTGPLFGYDKEQRDLAIVDAADKLEKATGVTPKYQEIYEERSDGKGFDKVTFKPEEVNGDLVWQEKQDKVTAQEFADRLDSFYQEPENLPYFDRNSLSKEELTQIQSQVDEHHDKLASNNELTAGINDIEKETASQTPPEQQEILRNEELQRQQGISR